MLGAKNIMKCIQDPIVGTLAFGNYELPIQVEKNQALHFLRHHLNATLKNEYMTEEDPKVLWHSLKDHYGHQQNGFVVRVILHVGSRVIDTTALLDSRATTYFMDMLFARTYSIPKATKTKPVPIEVIDKLLLLLGAITKGTTPL